MRELAQRSNSRTNEVPPDPLAEGRTMELRRTLLEALKPPAIDLLAESVRIVTLRKRDNGRSS